MEMNFSETAEDNLAMAGEFDIAEEMKKEIYAQHAREAAELEGAAELEEARLEAEARRHNGFFARD